MRSKQRTVEYKETSVFELFPEFEYTRRQRVRCVLFHAYAKNYRKIINYAAHFDAPNKLCIVWIVGQPKPELIAKALSSAGCSDRVCVMTSPFPQEKMGIYEAFSSLAGRLLSGGYYDKEKRDVNDSYIEYHNNIKMAIKKLPSGQDRESLVELYKQQEDELEIIHQYKRLAKACRNTYFKKFTCYRAGCLAKPFTFDRLDSLIVKVFPYGSESMQVGDSCSIMPSTIDKCIKFATTGEPQRGVDFKLDDDTPAVRLIRRFLNKKFLTSSGCSISELRDFVTAPPLGFGENGFSAACLAYALKRYENRTVLYYDSVSTFILKRVNTGLINAVLSDSKMIRRRADSDACLYIESHPHKVIKKMISDVFGVPILVPGFYTATKARCMLEQSFRLPVALADERLYKLVSMESKWHDTELMNDICNELDGYTDELCASFECYKSMDAELTPEERVVYPSAAPWLWDRDYANRRAHEKGKVLLVQH